MRHFLTGALLVALAAPAFAGDWPQFRGPGGSGVSDAKKLPTEWGNDKNIRWKAPLPGRGLSSPVVSGDRIFVTASGGFDDTRLHVLCFSLTDGKKLWERQLWATGNTTCHPTTCMAAPTPVTDGKSVFALFATGDLAAFTVDGELLWYRSLVGDYPAITNQVGMASSPVLAGDVLVVPMENDGDSFAAGIDARTGQNRWKAARRRDINWVTPLVIGKGDQSLVVLQSAEDLTAYQPETGQKKWSLKGDSFSTIPSPIAVDGKVLTPGDGLMALEPAAGADEPKLLWQAKKLRPAGYATPLYFQKRVYVTSSVGLVCADLEAGKEVWLQRAAGPFAASPVAGDGKIYLVNDKGTTYVIQPGPQPSILATNKLDDKLMATPALVEGAVLLRSDGFLYCIGEKS